MVVERIIDAWNGIINSSTEEFYVEYVLHFRRETTIQQVRAYDGRRFKGYMEYILPLFKKGVRLK